MADWPLDCQPLAAEHESELLSAQVSQRAETFPVMSCLRNPRCTRRIVTNTGPPEGIGTMR